MFTRLPVCGALLATAAVVAVAGLTGPPASAGQLTAGSGRAVPACAAGVLRASLPSGIPGDPAGEQGQVVLNVVLVNNGHAACSLRGWPGVTVLGAHGRAVAAPVTDAGFSNLGPVPDRPVTLPPGGGAVLTLTGTGGARGCATAWSLRLTVAGHRLKVSPAAGLGRVCLGGRLYLAPFFPEDSLQSAVRALRVSAVPSPFRTTTAAEPPACTAADLAVRVSGSKTSRSGTVVALALGSTRRACVLASGGWPTVRANLADGSAPVAARLPYAPAVRTMASALTAYPHPDAGPAAVLLLRPGRWSRVVLLAPAGSGPGCRAAASVTVYPSEIALGAGRSVPLPRPVAVCGQLRSLPYLPAGPTAGTLALAGRALRAAVASPASGITPDGDSVGYYYGSDGPTLMACGSAVPYTEASSTATTQTQGAATPPQCTTTDGKYGGYMGEIGKWDVWEGCDSNGMAWNATNYNDANADYLAGDGVGSSGYWMLAGPGRDPHYNATTAEATAWGAAQAAEAMSLAGDDQLFFMFMDIEQYTHDNEIDNGWHTAWTSACGTTATNAAVASSLDLATVNGFANFIDEDTNEIAGVYSAGGGGSYEWDGIFGGATTGLPEWTYQSGASSITQFPAEWTIAVAESSGAYQLISASFFGGPQDCDMAWQWTGGGGHTNPQGYRIDQFSTNDYLGPCGGPRMHPGTGLP